MAEIEAKSFSAIANHYQEHKGNAAGRPGDRSGLEIEAAGRPGDRSGGRLALALLRGPRIKAGWRVANNQAAKQGVEIMESIEELKARHAKEMQRLESEQALAALAPIPPRRAMLVSTGEKAWLTYEAADLWAALDIMAKFEPLAFYKFKGTYTRFEPEAQNDKRTRDKGEETGGPFVALIDVNHGEGFGPCVCLAFFAYLGADICKIKVDLRPEGYRPASWWQYGPRFQADSSGRGRRLDGNRYVQGDWRANEKLYGMTDSCVTWGSGSPESTHYTFAIMADNEGAGGLAEWQEARLRLENLALALHGERKAESE